MAKRLTLLQVALGLLVTVTLLAQLWHSEPAASQDSDEQMPTEIRIMPALGYKPIPATKQSEQGKILFQELNCMACHQIHNVGGDLAPFLDGVGGRRDDQFLLAHLSNAAQARDDYKRIRGMDFGNSLPHSRYSPETAQLLVDYLKTLPEPAGGFLVFPHVPRTPVPASSVVNKNFRAAPKSARSEEGAALYSKFSCVACHATGDIGGWFGPRLDGVGARRDRAFIVAHITDAQAQARVASGKGEETSAKMPRFAIAPDEVNKIADYLLTIPDLK